MTGRTPTRFLAIDLGSKRTGIAVGDSITRAAMPLKVLNIACGPLLLQAIADVVHEHTPDALVIGLPLNMDGSDGPAAREARTFAAQIQERFALPVHLQDERLTSFAADDRMARTGRTRGEKKELRDALAAAIMLEDFLRALPA